MKKGFTLIELLAVIVILAVIALIAVPLILSLVDKSRMKAAEESALFYVDTIENMLMINNIENTDGRTYKVKGRTVVDENEKVILNLEIKGDVPYSGVANEIKINSGFIETANLRFNSYYVHYEMDRITKKFKICTSQKGFLDTCDGTGSIKPSEPEESKKDGPTIDIAKDKTFFATVYLDPTDISKKCTKEDAEANVNEFGTPTTIKSGCMKWYVYKEDGTNYTMILDHNTSGNVAWNSTNGKEMKEVKEQLEKDTESWVPSIKSTARLISADEVAELTGANREDTLSWSASKPFSANQLCDKSKFTNYYYFDGTGSTYKEWQKAVAITPHSSKYAWLYDYTMDCTNASTEHGCSFSDQNQYLSSGDNRKYAINGYWTSTRLSLETNAEQGVGVGVYFAGRIATYSLKNSDSYGIRPVITISKKIFIDEEETETSKNKLEEKLKLGDYISYTPANTSYTISVTDTYARENQTINPSELNLWRVIQKNTDGTIDVVSNYVSSKKVQFGTQTSMEEAYKYYIKTLNKIAKEYETEGFTVGSRHTGYNSDKALEVLPNIDAALDDGYLVDTGLIQEALGTTYAKRFGTDTNAGYWIASRGNPYAGYFQQAGASITNYHLNGFIGYIRPIVTLNSKLKVTSGDGSVDHPYELEI